MKKRETNVRAEKAAPMRWRRLAAAALLALVAVTPSLADDNSQKDYGGLHIFGGENYGVCENDIWINGTSLSGYREIHHITEYKWKAGHTDPDSTCLSHNPADSEHSIKSIKDYTYKFQTGAYNHSCICDARGGNCLSVNTEARNLGIYDVNFATLIWAKNGCGGAVVNGRQGGYFHHKNEGCFEVSRETVDMPAGSSMADVKIPNLVVNRDCRDLQVDQRLWIYETATKLIRSGKDESFCLVKGGTKAADPIYVQKCDAVTDEFRQWNYETGGGYSQIESTAQPGMCVDLINNDMTSGTKFQLHACTQNDAQEWRLAW